jgi:glycosyltransferase involved in cell wall biosynthesis
LVISNVVVGQEIMVGINSEQMRGSVNGTPLVSVIIPTFNRATFVPKVVGTVQQQTYRNTEILVIDDASKDDTSSVVTAISDPRIRYIRHDTNKGVSAARNTGIRAASGEYIAFIDDDDEWRQDKLEKQLEALNSYDIVACAAIADGSPLRVHKRPDITLDDLKKGGFAPSGLLGKAYVFRNVMFDENLKQGEDWDLLIRIAQQFSIGWVEGELLVYNKGDHARATNVAKRLNGRELEKRTAILVKHREFLGEKWFKYHLADTFLGYIGSRPDKLRSIGYAVRRCGVIPVVSVLLDKVRQRVR